MLSRDVLLSISESTKRNIESDIALKKGSCLSDKKYTICELRYIGDMGFVYLAKNNYTQLYVIIKEFYPQQCLEINNSLIIVNRNPLGYLELLDFTPIKYDIYLELIDKFLIEASLLSNLGKTDCTIDIVECFKSNNTAYIVTDYVEWPTLRDIIHSKEIPGPKDIIAIYSSILHSTRILHDKGIIHRDLKPSNILISPDKAILADLGISKLEVEMNRTMTVSYSEDYAAPEQKIGTSNQGTWSDVYSLGKLLEYLVLSTAYANSDSNISRDNAYEYGLYLFKNELAKDILLQLISSATIEDSTLRLQNISDMQDILSDKKMSKANKKPYILSLTIAIAIIIFVISLTPKLYTSKKIDTGNTISDFSVASADIDTHVSPSIDVPLAFLTEQLTEFAYTEDKIVRWTDTNNRYNIVIDLIDLNTWTSSETYLGTIDDYVNFDNIGLNPSSYRMYMHAYSKDSSITQSELKFIDFTITSPVDYILQPIDVSSKYYSYYDWEDKLVVFDKDKIYKEYHLSLMDKTTFKTIFEISTVNNSINLDYMTNQIGDYILIVEGQNLEIRSFKERINISISPKFIPKKPIFITEENSVLKLSDDSNIEWENIESAQAIYLSLYDVITNQYQDITLDGNSSSVNINSFELEPHSYKLILSYQLDGRISKKSRLHFYLTN